MIAKPALLYYSERPLDDFLSIEVAPASVSTLLLDAGRSRIAQVNQKVPA